MRGRERGGGERKKERDAERDRDRKGGAREQESERIICISKNGERP